MGNLTDSSKERFRSFGWSEQEIAFHDSENQKDWEPLLRDPNTPTNVIKDIVDRITLLPLKILAFKHPNIDERAQAYMLSKADNKAYQKDLIEAFLSNSKNLEEQTWTKIRKFHNTAGRFDICILELLEEQSDVFTKQKLDVILNALGDIPGVNVNKMKYLERWLKVIMGHKNFDVSILAGTFFTTKLKPSDPRVINVVKELKNKEDISYAFYKMTNEEVWLSDEAKELFIFKI